MTTKERAGNWAVAVTVRWKDGKPIYSSENEALVYAFHLHMHGAKGEDLSEVPTHADLEELEATLLAHGLDPNALRATNDEHEPHAFEPPKTS